MAHVIWLTGLSGAGKTTLANSLEAEFKERSKKVEVLDGDIVRNFFGNDLGYSRRERIMNVKRIAFVAMLLSKNGIDVIVANIAPYYEVRDFIRKHLDNYIQIYVKAPPDVLRKRDVQGHYAKIESGDLNNMVGVDDVYDIPRRPDVVIDTGVETVAQSMGHILDCLKKRGVLK